MTINPDNLPHIQNLRLLAESALDPDDKKRKQNLYFRAWNRAAIDSCANCPLAAPKRTHLSGPSPTFLSFVAGVPQNLDVDLGQNLNCQTERGELFDKLIAMIGFRRDELAIIYAVSCARKPDVNLMACADACKGCLGLNLSLACSKVVILSGPEAASLLVPAGGVVDMKSLNGTWQCERMAIGVNRYYWIVHDLDAAIKSPTVMRELMASWGQLGSFIHWVWQEWLWDLGMPGEKVQSLSYEQICDIVAGMIKNALVNIRPGERTREYLKIMSQFAAIGTQRGQAGVDEDLAMRAFWDPGMAKRIGIDVEAGEREKFLNKDATKGWVPRSS